MVKNHKSQDKRKSKGKRKHRPKGKRKGKGKKTMAQKADPFLLYQQAVQCPEAEISFFDKVYRQHYLRPPLRMREDFCGTALLAAEWADSHPERSSIGVDLHGPTLAWARKNVLAVAPEAVQQRVTLVQDNVLNVTHPKVDVLCALNFSYCIFKQRQLLLDYFRVAHQSLDQQGMFFCELYGGTEAIVPVEEERKLDGFTYVWEQASFNPINRHTLCYIHFTFKDGSCIKRAFTYDWRLWTIPEVRELLLEAGFSRVDVYWDPVADDEDDECGIHIGTGDFRLTEEEENQEGWLAYLVGFR